MTSSPRLDSCPSPSGTGWNPWPAGLIAFLVVFVMAVVSFGVFAIRQPQDLVSVDYYDREIRHQEQIDRVTRADVVSDAASVSVDAAAQALCLALPPGSTGQVEFYRPANARWDRTLPLAVDQRGRQRMDLTGLQAGLWRIRVSWTVGGLDCFREVRFVSRGGE